MKIMFICLSLSGGGTERVIANLANYLSKKHEVVIIKILNKKNDYTIKKNIKMHILDANKKRKSLFCQKLEKISIKRIIALKKIILDEKPSVILCFLPLPSLYTMLLKKINSKINKIPIILSERGAPNAVFKNRFIKCIMAHLYNKCDGFVFQTPDAKEFYKNILKCETRIIGNPINEKFMKDKPASYRNKTIVTVGRLEKQKNHKLLIDAFEKVNKKYSDYKLLIYGEGSLKEELSDYIKQKKLINNVILMGRCDKLYDELYNSGMFVLSSNFEGMPNALMESLALGLPCISTDCPVGGPKMLINDHENGILVPINDFSQLCDAMLSIIENKKFAEKLSKNAINSIQHYNPNKINEEWESYIKNIYAKGVK